MTKRKVRLQLSTEELQDMLLDAAQEIDSKEESFACEAIRNEYRRRLRTIWHNPPATWDDEFEECAERNAVFLIKQMGKRFKPRGIEYGEAWWNCDHRNREARKERVLALLFMREIVRDEAISQG